MREEKDEQEKRKRGRWGPHAHTQKAVPHATPYCVRSHFETDRRMIDGEELSAITLADRLFACTTCGNCEEGCPIEGAKY
jgi:ferredoxin